VVVLEFYEIIADGPGRHTIVLPSPYRCIGWNMYRYDLFVSYKREPSAKRLVTPWLREVLNRIEYWVGQDMGGVPIEVFFDEDSIEVGSNWPDEIRTALLTAKCLLPIWSPEYFHSSWCMAEWKSFLRRERQIAGTDGSGCRLIFPIKFHDGVWFPEEARQVQQLDLSMYTGTTPAFWATQRADELDQLIKRSAPNLARLISSAPPYETAWPVDMAEPKRPPEGVGMARL